MRFLPVYFIFLLFSASIFSQERSNHAKKFEQLDNILRSPNEYRGADGATSDLSTGNKRLIIK